MLCLPALGRPSLPGNGMTPQEQQLLDDFLARLRAGGGVAKDPQADALIRDRLAGQPDATYLLVQRALLLEQALEQARAQIAHLQQAGAAPAATSFLGQGWGASPPPLPPAAPAAAPGWRERLFGGATPEPASQAAPAARGPGFLGTAASTAAGVAGGMFLFQGLENLFGGHHGGGGFLGGNAGQDVVVENVTTNNYYDDARPADAGGDGLADDAGFADDSGFDDSDWT